MYIVFITYSACKIVLFYYKAIYSEWLEFRYCLAFGDKIPLLGNLVKTYTLAAMIIEKKLKLSCSGGLAGGRSRVF